MFNPISRAQLAATFNAIAGTDKRVSSAEVSQAAAASRKAVNDSQLAIIQKVRAGQLTGTQAGEAMNKLRSEFSITLTVLGSIQQMAFRAEVAGQQGGVMLSQFAKDVDGNAVTFSAADLTANLQALPIRKPAGTP